MSGVRELAQRAKRASRVLAQLGTEEKNSLLVGMADELDAQEKVIRKANQEDVAAAKVAGTSGALLDRLELTEKRFREMVEGVRHVAKLPDPVGEVIKKWNRPNKLEIFKVRVPIGLIGIIYESRPNVTVDSAVLCLKAGNATLLRGGREAKRSNRALADVLGQAAKKKGLPLEVVTLVEDEGREGVAEMCGLEGVIDLLIPRGGSGLIAAVVENARVPVIKHADGICHVFVHRDADPIMAESITVNSKCQRPATCNAAETLLVDRDGAEKVLPRIVKALQAKGVKFFGDLEAARISGQALEAPKSWKTEYLDLTMAIRVVDGLKGALEHIEEYGSHHSDTIVTEDRKVAEEFMRKVDSAAVYWNASTRFTDGAEFGFGAEIGISTDKIHARGPMGLEELTSYKYVVAGQGQIRD
ncbi:MAG: glutamate-5-semialdehyde dehydrogenase [Candidatus Pacebacteria bacterium]|nr:glutamate-5-semialdehyde dehydrogenase [Candidatus Paceibacterota bacterium]